MDETPEAGRTRMTAEQRRESILLVATEMFAVTGYRAGKVSDIAARLGVSEPVIFQNFGSKAALFAAVLDRLASDIHAEMDALAAHHGSVADLLAHVLSPAVPGTPNDGHISHRALFAEGAAMIAEPGAGETARDVARVIAGHLADLLRRGQADGSIRADLEPDAAAWLLLSVLSSRPFRTAAMPNSEKSEGSVADLVLRAILMPG